MTFTRFAYIIISVKRIQSPQKAGIPARKLIERRKLDMASKWFSETFLQSIFETVGAGKQKWLTARQTMICTDNMQKTTVRYDSDGYGTMHSHDNYACKWNGRDVKLFYSKRNGCGRIEFGYNAEEIQTMRIASDAEKEKEKTHRIERIKANPERLEKCILTIKTKIDILTDNWQAAKDDNDCDAEDDAWYSAEVEKLETELALYTS